MVLIAVWRLWRSTSNKDDSPCAVVEGPRQVRVIGQRPSERSDGAVVVTNRERNRGGPDSSCHLYGARATRLDRVGAAPVSRRVKR